MNYGYPTNRAPALHRHPPCSPHSHRKASESARALEVPVRWCSTKSGTRFIQRLMVGNIVASWYHKYSHLMALGNRGEWRVLIDAWYLFYFWLVVIEIHEIANMINKGKTEAPRNDWLQEIVNLNLAVTLGNPSKWTLELWAWTCMKHGQSSFYFFKVSSRESIIALTTWTTIL